LYFQGSFLSLGTISGIKAVYPTKSFGVVWIDAHADLHSPYTSPSGNIHGMPLSAALGEDNLDCQINEIPENVKARRHEKHWYPGTKIRPENLIYFVRDTEEAENKLKELGIRNYMVDEVRYRGLQTGF
jgi:arginase